MFDFNIMNDFEVRFYRGLNEYYKLEFENNT